MLSTDSISQTQSSIRFSGSINERPMGQEISMVETTLRVTELSFLELCKSSTSFKGQSEFRMLQRSKSQASVLQVVTADSSGDVIVPVDASASSKSIRPTPLDFTHFLPWLCAAWQSPQLVLVKSVVQEEYVSVMQDNTSKASKSAAKSKMKVLQPAVEENVSEIISKLSQSSLVDMPLYIHATFDSKSHLVEVAIKERFMDIHRKTVQAISVCIPFHCLLTRLTLRWTKLNNILIYEIAKFLPNSYLTDIILDDTRGRPNYDILLAKKSPLKYLSLNRCLIDDYQCMKIAANIDLGSGGETLNVLELGSNFITDGGALAIAESLRRNRNLMHLNLSGNMLTDKAAIAILSHLMKFRVRLDELMETKKRKRQYLQKKLKIYESCYREVVLRRQGEETLKSRKSRTFSVKTDYKSSRKLRRRPSNILFCDDKDNDRDEASRLTLQRVGEFIDSYNKRSTISENEWTYCTGNVVLCSLNLAYNNLGYYSLLKIHEVLKYQNEMMASEGLKRIIFYGNQLPVVSDLYSKIKNYLQSSVTVALEKNPLKKEKQTTIKPSRIRLA